MRPALPLLLEMGRIRSGDYASPEGAHCGAFCIIGPGGMELRILASDGSGDDGRPDPMAEGWEHVSVSGRRCPNWNEMAFVKNLFWGEDEAVAQFHPRKKDYVNYHPTCLHLWAHPTLVVTPPTVLVGPRTMNELREIKRSIVDGDLG